MPRQSVLEKGWALPQLAEQLKNSYKIFFDFSPCGGYQLQPESLGPDELWLDLARSVTARLVDGRLFLESQFLDDTTWYSPRTTMPPRPKYLHTEKAFQRFEQYRNATWESRVRSLQIAVKNGLYNAISTYRLAKVEGMTERKSQVEVMYEEDIPDLLRYLLGWRQKRVIARHCDALLPNAAMHFIPLQDEYLQAWGKTELITDDFIKVAEAQYFFMFSEA